jgi:MFS family permease
VTANVHGPLWSRPLGVVMATLFLGSMVPNLFVIAPRYLGVRGFDEQEIGVVMSAFNLTALAVLPGIGWLVARFGHARVLSLGSLVCAAGAAVFWMSSDAIGFTLGRALQGIGFSAVLVGAAAYVAETAPLARMGEALGLSGVLTLAAQAAGPALGEALLPLGWETVFGAAVVGGVAGAAVALALPPARRVDPAAIEAPTRAAAILTATGLAGVGFGAIWIFLADYTRQVGIERTSWFFTPYVVAAISTRLVLGRLADRIGRRQAAVPALAGHALILLVMVPLEAAWQLVVVGIVYGLCHGIYYPTLQAMVVERSGGRRSRAVAASTFAFGFGIIVAGFGLGAVARAWSYQAIYPVASAAGLVAVALVVRGGAAR